MTKEIIRAKEKDLLDRLVEAKNSDFRQTLILAEMSEMFRQAWIKSNELADAYMDRMKKTIKNQSPSELRIFLLEYYTIERIHDIFVDTDIYNCDGQEMRDWIVINLPIQWMEWFDGK